MFPRMASPWMLDHATPTTYRLQRGGKTATVISFPLSLPCSLAMKRLSGPEVAPSLTRWMCHDRVRTDICTSVHRFVPRLHAFQLEIAATRLNVKRRYCPFPLADHWPRLRPPALSLAGGAHGCGSA